MNYKVVWEIELDADTPLEAAQEAMSSMYSGTAKVFTVEEGHKIFEVDLCNNETTRINHYTPLIKKQ